MASNSVKKEIRDIVIVPLRGTSENNKNFYEKAESIYNLINKNTGRTPKEAKRLIAKISRKLYMVQMYLHAYCKRIYTETYVQMFVHGNIHASSVNVYILNTMFSNTSPSATDVTIIHKGLNDNDFLVVYEILKKYNPRLVPNVLYESMADLHAVKFQDYIYDLPIECVLDFVYPEMILGEEKNKSLYVKTYEDKYYDDSITTCIYAFYVSSAVLDRFDFEPDPDPELQPSLQYPDLESVYKEYKVSDGIQAYMNGLFSKIPILNSADMNNKLKWTIYSRYMNILITKDIVNILDDLFYIKPFKDKINTNKNFKPPTGDQTVDVFRGLAIEEKRLLADTMYPIPIILPRPNTYVECVVRTILVQNLARIIEKDGEGVFKITNELLEIWENRIKPII